MILNNSQGHHLLGFYKGLILKHCENGKCKVFIPGVYDDKYNSFEESKNLPDAEQITPLFGGSKSGNGLFSYPNIGSIVICSFFNNDLNYPFFFGSILCEDNASDLYTLVKSENTEDALKRGDDARIHRIRVDHATIEIAESGNICVKTFEDREGAVNSDNPKVGCKINISESGTVTITSSNQVCIDSPDVMINTDTYTLNCQTYKVNAGNQAKFITKALNVNAETQMDFTTRTENHMDSSFNITNNGQVRIDGNYIQITGKTHPPIFL